MAIIKRSQITNVGKDMEKREPLYTVDGYIYWYRHYGKQYGSFSKKLKIELSHDPSISFLGVYPKTLI